MSTAVASPANPLGRLGWNGGNNNSGGFTTTMSTDEVSRMFMPQRKVVQRSNSSSSVVSSASSTSTVTSDEISGAKKKPRGGFWPASKVESTAGVTSARANGSVQPVTKTQPALPTQTNGARSSNQPSSEPSALLALLPMNGTFERKQINVPFFPDVLRVGRQTNAKTVPTPINGFFDSKVLSRQHAEVWAERTGKVFIRDVKSSNGTFVNGQRLSPENRESEPHELHQHDTLELGIDIVSEDQKTIVHHKVSAKVEYVGLPNTSNDVLNLNFGDLDPSHGSLLSSPLSSPMTHSRSRPGGPIARSNASSVAGSQVSSMPQRQLNFWGAPLNIEQLVKTLSTEMRVAKQQAQELDQAGTYLTAVLAPEGDPAKNTSQSKPNGRVKNPRLDHIPRFADPPAPPPQQPLPEKPDSTKSSPVNQASFTNFLKRSDTAKPGSNSPTHNSQMLALIEALSVAKKDLDLQGARVKELEDMLKKERSAREDAEERAKKLEQHVGARPVVKVEQETELPSDDIQSKDIDTSRDINSEHDLRQRLDTTLAQMKEIKENMDKFQHRAEVAENDAKNTRASLVEMIARLREENANDTLVDPTEANTTEKLDRSKDYSKEQSGIIGRSSMKNSIHANGHVQTPNLPESIERAVTTIFRQGDTSNGDTLAQSAPYVSMLGVVLLGISMMAYFNSWQKNER